MVVTASLRDQPEAIRSPGSLPVVVITLGSESGGAGPAEADVIVAEADVQAMLDLIDQNPLAAKSLAVLLRDQPERSFDAGLAAESAVYSMLQTGPEFARWRTKKTASSFSEVGPAVRTHRDDDHLHIMLDRPERHNAVSTALRDELTEALQLGIIDSSIESITLTGNGPSFSSGGDLDEFGSRPDSSSAHITRLARSPGRLIARLVDRIEVRIHGATMGGGIEMAAFAGRVVADPGTRIALPELGLGLIPGAGGTVSVTHRIGRQRTAWLALSTSELETKRALAWGLIDSIDQTPGQVPF